jgi:hypothetical protein
MNQRPSGVPLIAEQGDPAAMAIVAADHLCLIARCS